MTNVDKLLSVKGIKLRVQKSRRIHGGVIVSLDNMTIKDGCMKRDIFEDAENIEKACRALMLGLSGKQLIFKDSGNKETPFCVVFSSKHRRFEEDMLYHYNALDVLVSVEGESVILSNSGANHDEVHVQYCDSIARVNGIDEVEDNGVCGDTVLQACRGYMQVLKGHDLLFKNGNRVTFKIFEAEGDEKR